MEPARKKKNWMPQSHLKVLKECGRKSFGELRANASNRMRWRLKIDGNVK
jgi:hypothetical protein